MTGETAVVEDRVVEVLFYAKIRGSKALKHCWFKSVGAPQICCGRERRHKSQPARFKSVERPADLCNWCVMALEREAPKPSPLPKARL